MLLFFLSLFICYSFTKPDPMILFLVGVAAHAKHLSLASLSLFLRLQDIVTESASFDLIAFMPLLQERILTRNPFARQFIVSWVCI